MIVFTVLEFPFGSALYRLFFASTVSIHLFQLGACLQKLLKIFTG